MVYSDTFTTIYFSRLVSLHAFGRFSKDGYVDGARRSETDWPMGERKLSTRSHVQSFPRAFAFSFNVTMSVLNLPNYLAGTPFQARKVFSGLQFLHLRPKILWYYFAAGQLPGAKTPGRRSRNALGLNKHRHRLITIINALISLFVLPTVFRSVLYQVNDQLQRAYLANLVPMALSKKPWERGCPFSSSRLCFPF